MGKAFSATSAIGCIQGAVLRVQTQRRTRNRAVVALLMPAIIFIWLVGWGLYWIGHQREDKQVPRRKEPRDNVTLKAIQFEEPQEIAAQ